MVVRCRETAEVGEGDGYILSHVAETMFVCLHIVCITLDNMWIRNQMIMWCRKLNKTNAGTYKKFAHI